MAYYVASDHELAAQEPAGSPAGVYLEPAAPGHPVRAQLERPFVYYVGADGSCGCPFELTSARLDDECGGDEERLAELAAARRAVLELSALLETFAARGPVELYASWGGDEGLPRDHHRVVDAPAFRDDRFVVREREHLLVHAILARPS